MYPLITKPTRITSKSATCIDNVHITNNLPVSQTGIIYADILDHLPVFAILLSGLNKSNERPKRKRNFSPKNAFNLCSALQYKLEFDGKSVNKMYCLFLSKYLEFLNYYCPLRLTKLFKKVDNPWLTHNLMACCHRKQYLCKQSL